MDWEGQVFHDVFSAMSKSQEKGTQYDLKFTLVLQVLSSPSLIWCGLGRDLSQDVTLVLHLPCSPIPTNLQILPKPRKHMGEGKRGAAWGRGSPMCSIWGKGLTFWPRV